MVAMDLFLTLVSGTSVALPLGYIGFLPGKAKKGGKPGPKVIRKLENQLPAFLDSISSSLAVGNSLQQSIETAIQKDQTLLATFFETILLRVR